FDRPRWLKDMVDYRFKVAREMPVVIALGNSGIASESHAPEMCRLISDGLREHYGVKDDDQESWIVHIEATRTTARPRSRSCSSAAPRPTTSRRCSGASTSTSSTGATSGVNAR